MSRLEQKLKQQEGRPLLGTCAYTYNPVFVEMAGYMGFDILWVEMEHLPISVREAADLCRIASGCGLLTLIRIPDARRDTVLKAVECAPDILDLPMANTPEIVQELVRHAKYPPEGERGFFGSSRPVRYGLVDDIAQQQRRLNEDLCLMAQVETREAVEQAEALCRVPGLDAIFLGMGDLSANLGVSGKILHPRVQEAVDHVVQTAKQEGKRVATACAPGDAALFASKGFDALFLGSDIACMKFGIQTFFKQASEGLHADR